MFSRDMNINGEMIIKPCMCFQLGAQPHTLGMTKNWMHLTLQTMHHTVESLFISNHNQYSYTIE